MMVIGADEVGRGSLAGPVTVGAVLAPEDLSGMNVRDSKKLTAGQRRAIDATLRAYPGIKFALASRPASDIDKYGIAECLKQCFAEVVQKMMIAANGQKVRVLIDGEAIKGFPFQAEYDAQVEPLYADYYAKERYLWAGCLAQVGAHYVEYLAQVDAHYVEYKAKVDAIWADYYAKRDALFDEMFPWTLVEDALLKSVNS